MPFAGNEWQTRKMVPSGDLLTKLRAIYPDITSSGDTTDHETARTYAIPGHQGSIGFISSMSDHFCSTCNRLRVTADGQIKVNLTLCHSGRIDTFQGLSFRREGDLSSRSHALGSIR